MPNILDTYSRHSHFLEQYFNSESDKLMPYLNRIAKRLRLELTVTENVRSRAKIERLIAFTEKLVTSELTGFTDELSNQIELFAESEAEFAAASIDLQDATFTTTLPSQTQLNAAVHARPFNNRLLKDYLKDFSAEQGKRVRDAVSMGFYEGKTTQEIVRGVIGTRSRKYKDGLLNVTRTSGERMVRTALAHTASVAKNKVFEDNDDLIPYYEWVSTLDGHTSPICQKRDGLVWVVNKGPLPPAHYNCRSTTSPLFKEDVKLVKNKLVKLDQGGKRASRGGPVSADLNYNDWLGKQSKEFQIGVLGKTKADLFRKGGLTLDKFVNNRDQTLTLDQLKTTYPTAWAKI